MPQRTYSAPEEAFLDAQLDQTLADAGLPANSPVRALLARDAEIFQGATVAGHSTFGIRIPRPETGRDITLSERLEELRQDPLCRHDFPVAKPSVSKTDLRTMAENLADIASGKVTVM